jgi:hypothetical protein
MNLSSFFQEILLVIDGLGWLIDSLAAIPLLKRPSWIPLYHLPRGTVLHALAPDQGLEDPAAGSGFLSRADPFRADDRITALARRGDFA